MTITKKEYLSALKFDLDFLKDQLRGPFFFWWHGTRYNRTHALEFIGDISDELEKIAADRSYRPWK